MRLNPSYTRWVGALTVIVCFGLAISPAYADAAMVAAGQRAVRERVERDNGRNTRVSFSSGRENFLSTSETRITGNGSAYLTNGRRREFSYSVKVRRSDHSARDVDVDYLGGSGGGTSDDLSITEPRRNATVHSNRVLVAGHAEAAYVNIEIWNSRNQRIATRSAPVRGGRWDSTFDLDKGGYRVKVIGSGGRSGDELNFYVDTNGFGGSGGTNDDWVRIGYPTDNGQVINSRFDIFGTARSRDVRVEIFDSANRRVLNKDARVSNGQWRLFVDLSAGYYRTTVTSDDGRDRDEVRFSVRTDTTTPTEDLVNIEYPRNNSDVSLAPRIYGRAETDRVRIEVYDSSNRRVLNTTADVRSGRWNASTRLGAGSYRAVVSSDNNRDRDEVRFTIEGGFGGSGGSSESWIVVTQPRSNGRVREGRFEIIGTSRGSNVRIEVFNSSNRRVVNNSVSVRNSRWSSAASLSPGRYRAVVYDPNDRDRDEFYFYVDDRIQLRR